MSKLQEELSMKLKVKALVDGIASTMDIIVEKADLKDMFGDKI